MEENMLTTPTKRDFSLADILFAWFSLIAGYLLCRTVPVNEKPLGAAALITVVLIVTALFLKYNGHSFGFRPIAALVSALAAAASLLISDNGVLQFFAYVYALGAYGYMIYTATGNALGSPGLLLADWLKALFILPFCSWSSGELFRSLFHGRIKKGGSVALKILIGCGVTVIPTGIVLALLSYDADFSRLIKSLFTWHFDPISHFISLTFAVPVAMYLYGLYLSCIDHKKPDLFGAPQRERIADKMAFAPLLTVLAATIPLLFIYCLFFISQWQYYISGFTGVLPTSFSYAEYAREGFFQLCAVSVINLVILLAIILFSKRGGRKNIAINTLAVLFSLFTLILISTAIAKMVMYIHCYGLTTKRVYATWLMIVLAIVFLLIALSRFIKRVKVASVCAAILVTAFTLLSLCNVESVIARYNVDRFLDGSLPSVDLAALEDLGDTAIPELIRLAQHLEVGNVTPIKDSTYEEASRYGDLYHRTVCALIRANDRLSASDNKLTAFTINRARAKAALSEVYS